MAYLHCVFRYGQFEVIGADSDSTVKALDDFVTGDITYNNLFQFEEYSAFSEGTEVDTGGAAADATVIPVPDTTSFVIGQTIGIRLDVGTFHEAVIDAFTPDTDVTLSIGISSAAAAGSKVVTVNQLQGSTTGSVTRNYKADTAQQIKGKSVELEVQGFTYNGRPFLLNYDRDGNYDSRFTQDYLRLLGYLGIPTIDMSTVKTLDRDGRPYNFSGAGDFVSFFETYYGSADSTTTIGRILDIYGGGTGEAGLLADTTEAGNDAVSMGPIETANNNRT